MASIIILYVFTDVLQHKGLIRVMIPKKFPAYKIFSGFPMNKNTLVNTNKEWVKAIDMKELMNNVDKNSSGIECDVYFDSRKKYFDVHHDVSNSTGLNLDNLLQVYHDRGLTASIWLDFKNLRDSNYKQATIQLIYLRQKYGLVNKILVESNRADLLQPFTDSGFSTSYYTPFFNPYLIEGDSLKHWVDKLTNVISRSRVSAISGYYFQYPFLKQYFPNYPILIWSPNDQFSIINRWYKKQIFSSKAVYIALYP